MKTEYFNADEKHRKEILLQILREAFVCEYFSHVEGRGNVEKSAENENKNTREVENE